MLVSVGEKNDLGKALITENGCSILKINNDVSIVFSPIVEALEQYHFIVATRK
jgi:hypothetical protein